MSAASTELFMRALQGAAQLPEPAAAARIALCVVTGARRDPRAREGFGDFLLNLERGLQGVPDGHRGAGAGLG